MYILLSGCNTPKPCSGVNMTDPATISLSSDEAGALSSDEVGAKEMESRCFRECSDRHIIIGEKICRFLRTLFG